MENIKDEDIIDENTIKKLIKDGYSLKLLSLEFDIPMNLLKQYSNEIKEGNKTEEKIKLEENEKRKEEEERLKLEQEKKEEEEKRKREEQEKRKEEERKKLEQEKKEEEEKRKREEQEKRKEERIKLEQKKKEEEERIKLEQKKKEEEEKIKKEEQKKRTKESIKIKPETTLTVPSKMELLRQNYINLYYKTEKKVEKKETQTEEEREIVEKIIRKIEEIISEIEKADVIQTKQLCRILIEDINELNHYNISFEQLSKISKLIVSPRIDGKNIVGISKKDMEYLIKIKQHFVRKYANVIKEQVDTINDMPSLKKLDSEITRELRNKYPIDFGAIVIVINNRIDKLRQIEKTQVSVPVSITNIVKGLANGKLDLKYANQIIDQEVNRRLQTGPKNKFSLSEEEIRNRIYSQIAGELGKKGEEYPIKNAEDTLSILGQIQGNLTSANIRCVIKNFITCKKFDEARDILHKYSTKPHNILSAIEKNILEDELRKAELGNLIMKGIEGKDIKKEEEDAYFKLIEKGIKQGNIDMSQIILGMSKDGKKKITLSDVWIRPTQKMQGSR